MPGQQLEWVPCTTLSKQVKDGQSVAREFKWRTDLTGIIHIMCKLTTQTFGQQDYDAMISHVSSHRDGVPLGARRDGSVPMNSVGALTEKEEARKASEDGVHILRQSRCNKIASILLIWDMVPVVGYICIQRNRSLVV